MTLVSLALASGACRQAELDRLRRETEELRAGTEAARAEVATLRRQVAEQKASMDRYGVAAHVRLDEIRVLAKANRHDDVLEACDAFSLHHPGSDLLPSVKSLRKAAETAAQRELLDRAEQQIGAGDTGAALSSLDSFAERWPRSSLDRRRRSQRRRAEKLEKEQALMRKLASVTIQEISVDPRTYRSKRFRRRVACEKPSLREHVVQTDIAELNLRTRRMFSARCFGQHEAGSDDRGVFYHVEVDSMFRARMSQALAKRIVGDLRPGVYGHYLLDGEFLFRGQIDIGKPVMYLNKLHLD